MTNPTPHPPSFTEYRTERIAFRTCLVFTWILNTTEGWLPVEQLNLGELKMIRRLMDSNPLFPEKLYEFVDSHIRGLTPMSSSLPRPA